jgi:hypothetical protein
MERRRYRSECATIDSFALQFLLPHISLVGSGHLDEAEAARFFGMRIHHDGAALDLTVSVEDAGDDRFGETRIDASDKEIPVSAD